jgi:hypothetical protein
MGRSDSVGAKGIVDVGLASITLVNCNTNTVCMTDIMSIVTIILNS